MTRPSVAPEEVGWRLGRSGTRRSQLWVPYDRTSLIVGPQGSGKTLALLAPALMNSPGGALVTLTKPEDLLLTATARQERGRPIAVLDPFDLVHGMPPLVWDPVAGCQDPRVAERRAKAFAAGTVRGSGAGGSDQAARFYAGECAKVLQGFLHAAALNDMDLDGVLEWVAEPLQSHQASETLRRHPGAEPHWYGLLSGALHGDDRTAGNTITTLQQAMGLFFQSNIRRRCVPSADRPASDIQGLVERGGTIYLLGREDPYQSASPLMTAVTEEVLDVVKRLGESSPFGRLCPPFLACLDELPSTAPIPTLPVRMANERALGVSFIIAAQTWRQLAVCYGEDVARTLLGLANTLVAFGGGKDVSFYRDLSQLLGETTQVHVQSVRAGRSRDESWSDRRVSVLEPSEIRSLPPGEVLVLADGHLPLIASTRLCIQGRKGRRLLQQQSRLRTERGRP